MYKSVCEKNDTLKSTNIYKFNCSIYTLVEIINIPNKYIVLIFHLLYYPLRFTNLNTYFEDYDLKSDYRFLTCKLGINIHTIKSHDRIINFNHH